jgi:glycosyltransferase involved in cell wall biosynthesis
VREYVAFTILATFAAASLAVRRRYATVQVHNPPDFLIVAALLPKLLGARVILDIHDFAPELFALKFEGRRGARLAERILHRVERLATRLADAVVTVHEPYRRALETRGVPRDKITIVLNSLDEALLPDGPAPAANGFRVVYHGTVTPHYGVDLVVEAAAAIADDVPDLTLGLYGDGPALQDVLARADTLGVADRLDAPGWLAQRDALARLPGASVGVVANLPIDRNQDAMPTKLFEYVAMGIPAVACDLRAICEHFSEDEVAFFRAGDADDLARVLLEVARDPEAAAQRAAAARRRYEAYRWDAQARRYVDLLARLGDRRGPSAATAEALP